jgi:hypothetical protein
MPSNYYLLPYDHNLTNLGGAVWYPTWTRGGPATWSQSFPSSTPDLTTTFAACVVVGNTPPTGAISLGGGTKDLPPPPQTMSETLDDVADFQAAFSDWLVTRRL